MVSAKKPRIFAILISAVVCFGLLAGCGGDTGDVGVPAPGTNGESIGTQDGSVLAPGTSDESGGTPNGNAPSSETLAGPVPDYPSGYYTGALRLTFDGEAQEDGELFILLDRYETPEDMYYLQCEQSNRSAGLVIGEYPNEHDFYIDIYTPGTHVVRAFSVDGNGKCSEVYEGTYEVEGADFYNFGFSEPSNIYSAPFTLSFDGTEGGTVYYTLDGSDPLVLSVSGANLSQGTQLSDGELVLLPGTHTVTARCITDNGLISPMIQGTFHVPLDFDSASTQVEEDGTYEYICDGWGPLLRYDKATGEYENILDKKVTHLAVFTIVVEPEVSDGMMPESVSRAENMTKTYIYARISNGQVFRASSIGGDIGTWEEISDYDVIERVGMGWYRRTEIDDPNYGDYTHAFWNHVEEEQGVEEVAEKADLMLNGVALYCNNAYYTEKEHHGRRVYACDYDGSNERILWSDTEIHPILDAITGSKLLYHYQSKDGDVHMVYDMETGEHYANPFVNVGDVVAGYTSCAVYVNGNRIEIDYSKL